MPRRRSRAGARTREGAVALPFRQEGEPAPTPAVKNADDYPRRCALLVRACRRSASSAAASSREACARRGSSRLLAGTVMHLRHRLGPRIRCESRGNDHRTLRGLHAPRLSAPTQRRGSASRLSLSQRRLRLRWQRALQAHARRVATTAADGIADPRRPGRGADRLTADARR
jgi:hypothetical protein